RAEPGADFRIRFESNDAPRRPNQTRGEQGEESDVRADVVEDHAGPQVFDDRSLNVRLTTAIQHSASGARIELQPESCSGAPFDLRPGQGIARHQQAAEPSGHGTDDGPAAHSSERSRVAQEELRHAASRGHPFSTRKLPITRASIPELKK